MSGSFQRGSSKSDTPQSGPRDNRVKRGRRRASGVPLSTWPGGDLAQPGGYGLLVTPGLPPTSGARLGGRDRVGLGRPDEALLRSRGGTTRTRLLIRLRGNRHCRQTYLAKRGLSTPLGPTVKICSRPDVEADQVARQATGTRMYSRKKSAQTRM